MMRIKVKVRLRKSRIDKIPHHKFCRQKIYFKLSEIVHIMYHWDYQRKREKERNKRIKMISSQDCNQLAFCFRDCSHYLNIIDHLKEKNKKKKGRE